MGAGGGATGTAAVAATRGDETGSTTINCSTDERAAGLAASAGRKAAVSLLALLVARAGANPTDVARDTETNLTTRTDLRDVHVTITTDATKPANPLIVVRVVGQAPGILIGTSSTIDIQIAVPVEQWTTP